MKLQKEIESNIRRTRMFDSETSEVSEGTLENSPLRKTDEQTENENVKFQTASEKHLIQKQSAIREGIQYAKENDPPSLLDILTEGKKKSGTFASLMKSNNTDLTNFTEVIYFGSGTYTETASGIIRITPDKNIKFQIIKLTHELTNRKNLALLQEISKQVKEGTITPKKYGEKLAEVEFEGETNQIKVAADIGYRYEGSGSESLNKLIDDYAKDKSIDLTKKLKPNPDKQTFYEQQGQKLRNQYLEKNK